MSNQSYFGKVITVIRPADSIARGYTVPPQIIPVRLSAGALMESGIVDDTDADTELTYYIKALEDAKTRCDNDKQPCRIIIFTNGTTYHESFKQKIIEYFTNKETHIWCEYVQASTETKRRDELFEQFGSADFSVLLNHNIVSEGINIPSCSGVILGRFMSAVTLIQAIGRARRITNEDRADLKTGKLVPGEWQTYRKKTGLVYVFVDESSADNLANEDFLRTIIREMRDVNDGSAWWVGPEFGIAKNKGKGDDKFNNPQETLPKDTSDPEYDQKFADLLYIDPEVIDRLFKEEELLSKISNFDLKDPKALDKLVDIMYN
jgi:superfamily II DNA/RNA helicase